MKALMLSTLVAFSCASVGLAEPNFELPDTMRRANEAVFDRNKGSLDALYSRALQNHPSLQGRFHFAVDIDDTGAARECRVRSSTLRAPDLERELCQRIERFRFAPQAPKIFSKEIRFASLNGSPAATRPPR
jgi:hypothetical protein